jgi:hypothetical protein
MPGGTATGLQIHFSKEAKENMASNPEVARWMKSTEEVLPLSPRGCEPRTGKVKGDYGETKTEVVPRLSEAEGYA